MSSLSDGITLVDAITGEPIIGLDPDDATQWPYAYETDCVTYELPLDEMVEIEHGWAESATDVLDAPPLTDADRREFESWLDQVDDQLPRRRQVSPIELAMIAAHGCV